MSEKLPLAGLTVCVTGDVPGLSREQANAAVTALGGKPVASVSGRTGLVVLGEGAGVSKTSKARQHRVPVLDATAFLALHADPDGWSGEPVGTPLQEEPTAVDAPAETVEPQVPVSARKHLLTIAVQYPGGVREVRLTCRCGEAWLGDSIHIQDARCPADTDRQPAPVTDNQPQTPNR